MIFRCELVGDRIKMMTRPATGPSAMPTATGAIDVDDQRWSDECGNARAWQAANSGLQHVGANAAEHGARFFGAREKVVSKVDSRQASICSSIR